MKLSLWTRLSRVHSTSSPRPWSRRSTGAALPGLLSLIALTCLLTGVGQAQTRYQIIHLPTPDGYNSTALGLNDSGNVVGYSYQGDNSTAFLYDYSAGTIKDLGSLGGQATAATAINGANEVVGYGTDANSNVLAFRYTQSQGIVSLGTLAGGGNSEAFAINGAGQVAGDSQVDGDAHRPVLFTDGEVKDLGISAKSSDTLKTAYGINAQGMIVGRYDTDDGSTHGFLFSANRLTDLGRWVAGIARRLGLIVMGSSWATARLTMGARAPSFSMELRCRISAPSADLPRPAMLER